uniref:Uncharacterized protein n=1 Tax=Setaria italica TaxID=4555 RepID=K4AP00_SETIT
MVCFKLHLQLGFHASKHKAAYFEVSITCFLVSILNSSGCILSRFFW